MSEVLVDVIRCSVMVELVVNVNEGLGNCCIDVIDCGKIENDSF